MKKLWDTLSSRKLWATIAGCAGVYASEGEAGLSKIVALVVGYVVAQGVVDAAGKLGGGAK